jgi:acyl-CoA thioesterase-2
MLQRSPSPLWKPPRGRTVFGGILIGQAIQAAHQTVAPDFFVHHMNCSFHAPPDAEKPIYIRVSRTADGRSSASRDVKITQNETIFFSAQCTFSRSGRVNPAVHQSSPSPSSLGAVPLDPELSQSDKMAFSQEMVSLITSLFRPAGHAQTLFRLGQGSLLSKGQAQVGQMLIHSYGMM